MKIRLYQDSDFDRILHLFNENSDYDKLTPALLEEKLPGDPHFDRETTFVSEESGKPVGFMQGVQRVLPEGHLGFIKLMVVDKNVRRRGIARAMYERLEEIFRERQVDTVRIYDMPFNYWMPGIDPRYTAALCFAWRMGFERFKDTTNMVVDLQGREWVDKAIGHAFGGQAKGQRPKAKGKGVNVGADASVCPVDQASLTRLEEDNGIVIRRAGEDDKEKLWQFIGEQFALWRREVEPAFRWRPVPVHIALQEGRVVAFSAYDTNNFGTGWFGPMGTHPDLRGLGIGAILLKYCLQDLKEQGQQTAIIPWVAPIAFYSHYCGAVVDRVFWRFQKKLK